MKSLSTIRKYNLLQNKLQKNKFLQQQFNHYNQYLHIKGIPNFCLAF